MNTRDCLALLIVSIFLIFAQGQVRFPCEAAPRLFDEEWSHYDKCHFFDPRNRFWNYHHCEYVDCSYNNGSCADSIYGKWPVMVSRYSDGCIHVHTRVPVAPTASCWPGKTMTLCCTYMEDPSRIVMVVPFHERKYESDRYWPYRRQYDLNVTWGPDRPPVPVYPTPKAYPTALP